MTEPPRVPTPDLGAAALTAQRRGRLRPGALGDLAVWTDALAALRRHPDGPLTPARPVLVAFAADHGIAAREVTADRPAESVRTASALADRTGPVGSLAVALGVTTDVVDVGLDLPAPAAPDGSSDTDTAPGGAAAGASSGAADGASSGANTTAGTGDDALSPTVRRHPVRRGSAPFDESDALTLDEVARAIQLGRDTADRWADEGCELFIGAVVGVGVDVAAAALASLLTGLEPVEVAGRGTGVDDAGWSRRVAAVRDGRYRLTTGPGDAATLLRVAGGSDLAALAGFVLQAALRGIPTLVDDVPATVAAVLAHRFAPGAERYVLVPAVEPGPVHSRLLDLMNLNPLCPMDLGGTPGLPSLLLLPVLTGATAVVDAAPEEPSPHRRTDALDDWDRALL